MHLHKINQMENYGLLKEEKTKPTTALQTYSLLRLVTPWESWTTWK